MLGLADRLRLVLAEIALASTKARLVLVSKTQPVEAMLTAYQAGQRHFGENRVQEARDKKPFLPDDVELHLIGPLQKNKVKYCPGLFGWVHSLSDLETAQLLNQKCLEKSVQIKVLIQMNLSEEGSKSGLYRYDDLLFLANSIKALPGLKLVGLMTMGHPELSIQENQALFEKLAQMGQNAAEALGLHEQMVELSMGMSGDYPAALAAGATLVRVGSAIFGQRTL
ncbi:MAG: YggS family pyridoxal phosphate enzyme [Candidatus Lambdaproteobacteria bacterium RIFOXYD2_FULL_50_16]|uniref:Pyridoxal phosphate homeostasis protein n=1 Tax=Candidatus Lambdaproteobacteria bacterium RIFOXYD2_FULL_50_16 TaxID=1817772 RepID=A0A1F6G5D0_9PROT|nr:MAG: YggS family pyridoxal phosphate enzyme [Candidatus Lambdaproteobacteria bacterium RIFOXYD2_FULL_50_16]